MTPEQIEKIEDDFRSGNFDDDAQEEAFRALLAEWEERGSALDRAAIARGEAEAEIERLKEEARLNRAASEKHYALAEARGEQLDEAEARLAELRAEIERLKAEVKLWQERSTTSARDSAMFEARLAELVEALRARTYGRPSIGGMRLCVACAAWEDEPHRDGCWIAAALAAAQPKEEG